MSMAWGKSRGLSRSCSQRAGVGLTVLHFFSVKRSEHTYCYVGFFFFFLHTHKSKAEKTGLMTIVFYVYSIWRI